MLAAAGGRGEAHRLPVAEELEVRRPAGIRDDEERGGRVGHHKIREEAWVLGRRGEATA